MSITRKLLKGMGLTDEQVDTIIEAHTDTVDGLKADVSRYKADAGKLADVQKELYDLKAAGDGGYKSKYEKEHSDFEAFKSNITAKETKAAKEKAVRAFFESKNIQSIFARSIPKDLVILLRLVRKYDPIIRLYDPSLTYSILCKQNNFRKRHDQAVFFTLFLQSVANGMRFTCKRMQFDAVPRPFTAPCVHLKRGCGDAQHAMILYKYSPKKNEKSLHFLILSVDKRAGSHYNSLAMRECWNR